MNKIYEPVLLLSTDMNREHSEVLFNNKIVSLLLNLYIR